MEKIGSRLGTFAPLVTKAATGLQLKTAILIGRMTSSSVFQGANRDSSVAELLEAKASYSWFIRG